MFSRIICSVFDVLHTLIHEDTWQIEGARTARADLDILYSSISNKASNLRQRDHLRE